MTDDLAASAANYVPPASVASNTDVQAMIAAAVAQAVAQADAARAAAAAPKVLSPEEAVRAAIDNAGRGLGMEERFAELYRHLDTLAKKVGL